MKHLKVFISLILFLSLSFASISPSFAQNAKASVQSEYKQGIIVQTVFGKIEGYKDGASLAWAGIPYGKAPIGELRWKAPQDPDIWTGVKSTKKEIIATQLTANGVIGSDDALNLTIYRPNTSETNLPVLFYIHGGNNQTGGTAEFNCASLSIKLNAIVVSANHRLDILGFNNLPALKTGNPLEDSGNYALLDFNKALDWIKDNIKAFGGNPDNITISGFSAGGRDVLAMLASPIFEGKFKQAISFSGGITFTDPKLAQQIYAQTLAKLAVEDKIKKDEKAAAKWFLSSSKKDIEEVRAYLYSLPSDRLVKAFGNGNIRMASFPHLFADGAVIPKEASKTTKYYSVPLILLDSAQEFAHFSANDTYFSQAKKNKTLLTDPKSKKELAWTIFYGSLLYKYANVEDVIKTISPHYNAPIYSVRIDWGANTEIVGEEFAALWGAHHGIFLPLLTEKPVLTSSLYPAAFTNAGVKDAGRQLQNYFKNFIWSGNPNGNGLVKWQPWTSIPNQLVIDADSKKANVYNTDKIIDYEEVLVLIEKDNTIDASSKAKIIREVLNGRWFSKGLDKKFKNKDIWVIK